MRIQKKRLLRELKKSNVDYAIVIPNNTSVSEIGDLDGVLDLVKNDSNLFVMGTIDIQRDSESQVRKLDLLFHKKRIVARADKSLPVLAFTRKRKKGTRFCESCSSFS